MVVPSQYESLSLVTLEAFAVGTPVLGNAASAVVSGQLARSGGGVTFALDDDASFQQAVRTVGAERDRLGSAGKKFAQKHQWSAVVKTYLDEFERIRRKS